MPPAAPAVPTSSPIVGVIAGGPATVTGAEKVTLTSIRSPRLYSWKVWSCGADVSATAVTAGAARTVTVTVSLARWRLRVPVVAAPLPVAVSR